MQKKILQVLDHNVLHEGTHNSLGNPHNQYVGNTPPTAIMPAYWSSGQYYKVCSFSLDNTQSTGVTLAFDVIDFDENEYFGKWDFGINIIQRNFQTNNGIMKYIYASEYDRVVCVENVDTVTATLYHYEIWIKSKFGGTGVPMLYKRFTQVSNPTFVMYDRMPQATAITSGTHYSNIINISKMTIENPPNDGFEYMNMATFDLSAYTTFGITFNINRYQCETPGTSENVTGYMKCMIYFITNGTNVNLKFEILEMFNMFHADIFLIQDATVTTKYYLFARTQYPMQHVFSLETQDYGGCGNPMTITANTFTKVLPSGTSIFGEYPKSRYMMDISNNIYSYEINANMQMILSDKDGVAKSNTVNPQTVYNSTATDVPTLLANFNSLLAALKVAGVLTT